MTIFELEPVEADAAHLLKPAFIFQHRDAEINAINQINSIN